MMPPTPFRQGEAVWVELATMDPVGAATFYSALLGWSIREERIGHSIYRMCSLDGRDVAGISDAAAVHGGRARGWITYFAVDDVARSAQQAVTLGGELAAGPRYLPAAGTGATLIDPFGAVFGLFQGEARAGVEALNTVGALCWNELDTCEPVRSIDFYQSLFKFETETTQSPNHQPYTLLTLAGVPVAGVLALDNDWPSPLPSKWITYFNVESLDAAVAHVVDLGGTPGIGPVDSAHGRLQLVRDPGGHTVCLSELTDSLRPTRSGSEQVMTEALFDSGEFRQVCGHFPTGVTAVTATAGNGALAALTVNSFTSVSLEPAKVLFCLATRSSSFAALNAATRIAIHILAQDQGDIARRFARSGLSGREKLDGVPWDQGPDGVPLLQGTPAILSGKPDEIIASGDHVIFLIDVDHVQLKSSPTPALSFYRGQFCSPGQALTS